MQLKALYPIHWKDQALEAGDTFEAESPEDDALLEYWAKFGAYGPADQPVPPQPGPPASESETATPVMTTADMPSHVGRRQRAEQ